MNEIYAEYIKAGLAGLTALHRGNFLRPAELASTIVAVMAAPEAAAAIVIQLNMEVANGKA